MTYPVFLFAVVALLLAPGPTNTLVALAGAQSGHRSLWFLLPAELLGYLTMILPAAWFGAMIIESLPSATNVLKLTASVWVMYLAISLWKSGSGIVIDTEVSAKRVFATTALNPKALIVAFVLLPPPTDEQFLLKLALFALPHLAWPWSGAPLEGSPDHKLAQMFALLSSSALHPYGLRSYPVPCFSQPFPTE